MTIQGPGLARSEDEYIFHADIESENFNQPYLPLSHFIVNGSDVSSNYTSSLFDHQSPIEIRLARHSPQHPHPDGIIYRDFGYGSGVVTVNASIQDTMGRISQARPLKIGYFEIKAVLQSPDLVPGSTTVTNTKSDLLLAPDDHFPNRGHPLPSGKTRFASSDTSNLYSLYGTKYDTSGCLIGQDGGYSKWTGSGKWNGLASVEWGNANSGGRSYVMPIGGTAGALQAVHNDLSYTLESWTPKYNYSMPNCIDFLCTTCSEENCNLQRNADNDGWHALHAVNAPIISSIIVTANAAIISDPPYWHHDSTAGPIIDGSLEFYQGINGYGTFYAGPDNAPNPVITPEGQIVISICAGAVVGAFTGGLGGGIGFAFTQSMFGVGLGMLTETAIHTWATQTTAQLGANYRASVKYAVVACWEDKFITATGGDGFVDIGGKYANDHMSFGSEVSDSIYIQDFAGNPLGDDVYVSAVASSLSRAVTGGFPKVTTDPDNPTGNSVATIRIAATVAAVRNAIFHTDNTKQQVGSQSEIRIQSLPMRMSVRNLVFR